MKAIHNGWASMRDSARAVNYTQRYKKWKQFTTTDYLFQKTIKLWTIHKDTKNESNSQQRLRSRLLLLSCELYTKIQKMKAIHNAVRSKWHCSHAVNYTQRYKKWKQFTTTIVCLLNKFLLWTIHKDTKNESNSQRNLFRMALFICCELYTKIQKMKAIHNSSNVRMVKEIAVNYTQRYKKWKQFTTNRFVYVYIRGLWTIHKDTKNESNSQRVEPRKHNVGCCELYTKIQKMKAIHNRSSAAQWRYRAVNYTQRYKKWKQFTTPTLHRSTPTPLWTIHKDTKNESNSQLVALSLRKYMSCELYTKIQKMKAIHNRWY